MINLQEESRTIILNSACVNELKQEKSECDNAVEKLKKEIERNEILEDEYEKMLKRHATRRYRQSHQSISSQRCAFA